MGKIVKQVELSEILGKDPSTIWEWQDQGLPIKQAGAGRSGHQYDSAVVIDWLIQHALARTGTTKAQVELDILQLDLKKKRAEDALRENTLVPVDQVRPIWERRVLAAVAFMSGRASQLAGILEATPGIEAKRAELRRSDAQFLHNLGVHGESMQNAFDAFLARFPQADVQQLFHAINLEVALAG